MSSSIFSTKKAQEWSHTIKETCIPLLRPGSSPPLLKEAIDALVEDILSNFTSSDAASISDLLSASECKYLDTPFLFQGDIHPYLLTNLFRIFIHLAKPKNLDGEEHVAIDLCMDEEQEDELLKRVEQIDRRVRIMGDEILGRFKLAQIRLLTQEVENSMHTHEEAKMEKKLEDESLKKEIEGIFKDANLLRSSVLISIMEATTNHQGTLYLQLLCDMIIAFKNKVCDEDKRDNNALLATFINGIMNVPSYIDILGRMTKKEKEITTLMFASAVIGSAGSTFVSSSMKSKSLKRTIKDASWASLFFFLGGFALLGMGLLVRNRWVKMGLSILLTSFIVGVAISSKKKQEESVIKSIIRWFIIVGAISISVLFADRVHQLRASP
ncbi:unnamed protein product [Eruca vesicaria subsp. sativa]|uniref:DOG1 domain-containing protein n=1 Tax=Eruca vesicaria subsp. sativa TaxID=29727 RepID=A0ABC8MAY0_ERUVS|nr:unnamed protein product [Eruca vesicaria subsp. sativa]